jgi:hypothetical protein
MLVILSVILKVDRLCPIVDFITFSFRVWLLILSSVLVGLGYWIYWPLTYTTRNCRQLRRYHWSPHFTVHYSTWWTLSSLLSLQPAIPRQQLLTVEILQIPAHRSSCHSRPCRTIVNIQLFSQLSLCHLFSIIRSAVLGSLLYSLGADPTENTILLLLHACSFPREFVHRPFVESPVA